MKKLLVLLLSSFILLNCSNSQNQSLHMVFNDYKYGYVDDENNLVIDIKYPLAYKFSDGLAAVEFPGSSENKKGYIDEAGAMVIPSKYNIIGKFSNGLAVVGNSNITSKLRYGVINKKDEIVLDFKYTRIDIFEDVAIAEKNNKIGLISLNDEILQDFKFDQFSRFQCNFGIASLMRSNKRVFYLIKKDGTSTEIDNDYFLSIAQVNSNGVFGVGKNGKYGIMDTTMNLIFPCIYDNVRTTANNKFILATLGDEQYFLNTKNRERTISNFEKTIIYDNAIIVQKDGKVGILDEELSFIIAPSYDQIYPYLENYLTTKRNKKVGLIDLEGNQIFACNFLSVKRIQSGIIKAFESRSPDKIAIYNTFNNKSIEATFSSVSNFIDQRAIVSKDKKFGIINFELEEVIPLIYDKIKYNSEEKSFVCTLDKVDLKLDIHGNKM